MTSRSNFFPKMIYHFMLEPSKKRSIILLTLITLDCVKRHGTLAYQFRKISKKN